jgi:ribosomal protein S18 acetylase RimI-like enzyme
MAAAETWIVSRGVSECRLHVYSFNAGAFALYEELGYEPLSAQLSKDLQPGRPSE